jgi:hypothetical protein
VCSFSGVQKDFLAVLNAALSLGLFAVHLVDLCMQFLDLAVKHQHHAVCHDGHDDAHDHDAYHMTSSIMLTMPISAMHTAEGMMPDIIPTMMMSSFFI